MLHFTSNELEWSDLPLITSAAGLELIDADGRRYLDGLGGLYTTQIGHGRGELADAASRQIRQLDFFPTWNARHPRALELAAALAERSPLSGESSAFFVNSGSEAVEAMLKVVRQFHLVNEEPERTDFIAREFAYHGVTRGALALSGLPPIKEPFEPLTPNVVHVPTTLETGSNAASDIEAAIREKPDTIAAVVLEPVQNSGGSIVPPPNYWSDVRAICDTHGALLVADSTICSFGRIGTWFGVERFDCQPDIITFAKGLTSGYVPMGGMLISERVRSALDQSPLFLHGATFGGHPVAAAVALENIAIIEREGLLQNVLALESHFGDALRDAVGSHPLVTDVRGMGFFWTIELAPAWPDGRPLEGADYDRHFKVGLSDELLKQGLMCRVDDRDSPVIQFAPPLIADRATLDRLAGMAEAAVARLEQTLGY